MLLELLENCGYSTTDPRRHCRGAAEDHQRLERSDGASAAEHARDSGTCRRGACAGGGLRRRAFQDTAQARSPLLDGGNGRRDREKLERAIAVTRENAAARAVEC